MNAACLKVGMVMLMVFVSLEFTQLPIHGTDKAHVDQGPIVVFVRRTHGHLDIKIAPDPLPGKDPLWVLSALCEKYGPSYPVVAIVDDGAEISDLNQVSGIAAKAGFDKTRTFIAHSDSGIMSELNFGPALPFSMKGPFDREPNAPK